MNVYDFDRTIYRKDSSVQFYLFVIKKKPSIFFRCIFRQLLAFVTYYFGKISKEHLKENFFCFFKYIDATTMAEQFVEVELVNVSQWYLNQKKDDDVIVSASPEFLIRVFMHKVGIMRVIGSVVEPQTGKFYGKNCYGKEKWKRFAETYGREACIDEFYTDSYSDAPMAEKACKAYLVKKDKISPFWKKRKMWGKTK